MQFFAEVTPDPESLSGMNNDMRGHCHCKICGAFQFRKPFMGVCDECAKQIADKLRGPEKHGQHKCVASLKTKEQCIGACICDYYQWEDD